ncbi:hypothetical protein [Pelagibius sp. Alg239-R121]|uniref:hypothetical protein n=1 Tax=Pelagibius sp. Alg239-R121 TaxID=2993448 RepID=UPI0024A7A438|nr:hypothetical protein [Pelagibius sp. Alg239-R121]
MNGTAFLVPTILWDLGFAAKPWIASPSQPWMGGVIQNPVGLYQFLSVLDPLILGLNMAGYEVDGISFAAKPGGYILPEDATGWLFLSDLSTMELVVEPRGWSQTQPIAVRDGAEAIVAIAVRPRRMFMDRDPSYALPLPTTASQFDFEQIPAEDGTPPTNTDAFWDHALDTLVDGTELKHLQLSLKRAAPSSSVEGFLSAFLAAMERSVTYVLGLIEYDILDGAAAWMENPDPAHPHGLLGAYIHSQWTFPGQRWTSTRDVKTMDSVGEDLWTLVFPDAAGLADFLHKELRDEHNLGDLVPKSRSKKPFSREFETAVEARWNELYGTGPFALKHKLSIDSYINCLMRAHNLGAVDILGSVTSLTSGFDPASANVVEFDATGWYESRMSDAGRTLPGLGSEQDADIQLLQINQAGPVLSGYWQTRTTDPGTGYTVVTDHILGATAESRPSALVTVQIGDTAYDAVRHEYLFARTPVGTVDPPVTGRLILEEIYEPNVQPGDDTIFEVGMDINYTFPSDDPHVGAPVRFVRISQKSHLSREAILSLSNQTQAGIEATQRRSLHSAEIVAWAQMLDTVIHHVDEYIHLSDSANKEREARAADQALRSGAARYMELAADGTIINENGQVLVLRAFAQHYLAGRTLANGPDSRTAFAWLNEMLLDQDPVAAGIEKALDLTQTMQAVGGTRPWTYRWVAEFSGAAFDIPALPAAFGGFGGTIEITKVDRVSKTKIWSELYTPSAGFVGKGPGMGVVFQMASDGEIVWSIDWSEYNFEGKLDFTSGGADLVVGGGISLSVGSVTFYGNRVFVLPMSGNASGMTRMSGFHAGAGASVVAGAMTLRSQANPTPITEEEIADYLGRSVAVDHLLDDELPFFNVGVTTLTPEGWFTLARACAEHRAALESPMTDLHLTGHASTTAGDNVNLPLSAERAAYTYDAMRALLGPAFGVAEANTFVGHRGEYDALLNIPDNTEDPKWRRVDVWFDASMLVRL